MNTKALQKLSYGLYLVCSRKGTEFNGQMNPDGAKSWPNANSGWVKNIYQEINNWNQSGKQPIRAVLLYRWSQADDWNIDDKPNVQQDFREAVAQNYRWLR